MARTGCMPRWNRRDNRNRYRISMSNQSISFNSCMEMSMESCLFNCFLENGGLLRGIDVNNGEYYTSDLKMDSLDDIQWILKPGVAWEAVKRDAADLEISPEKYMTRVQQNVDAFLSREEVYDNKKLKQFLERTKRDKTGRLRLILGGKSVGKSFVLSDFEEENSNNDDFLVLKVDGRDQSGCSLATAILREYKALFSMGSGQVAFSGVEAWEFIKPFAKNFVGCAVVDGIDQIVTRGVTAKEALDSLISLAELQSKKPILIIDEANEFWGLGGGQNATSDTLSAIVKMTKQENKLNVIMACSEHAYPRRLQDQGLNLQDISNVIYAGEISPHLMWNLATKEFGMGGNLARLFMGSYGGHLMTFCQAIEELVDNDEFIIRSMITDVKHGINRCFIIDSIETMRLVRGLATRGYVPLENPDDEILMELSKEGVGGVVATSKATVVDFSIASLNSGYGFVPTSESARFVMAEIALEKEREKETRTEKKQIRLTSKKKWFKRLRFWKK